MGEDCDLNALVLNYNRSDSVTIKAKTIEGFVNLEESEICEGDTILVEFASESGKFVLKSN